MMKVFRLTDGRPTYGAISAAHCAAFCLARLRQKQRKTSEARRRFDFVFDWLAEGFETKDRKDAKALLEGLSARV